MDRGNCPDIPAGICPVGRGNWLVVARFVGIWEAGLGNCPVLPGRGATGCWPVMVGRENWPVMLADPATIGRFMAPGALGPDIVAVARGVAGTLPGRPGITSTACGCGPVARIVLGVVARTFA